MLPNGLPAGPKLQSVGRGGSKMPFTFAHPLYVVPLKWMKPSFISLTGLILGSMAPDFEYFLALEPYQSIGHSTKGLLLQGIPLSILLAFLFHGVIKAPLACHLPGWFNLDAKAGSLVCGWRLIGLGGWAVFVVSVALGFYSHIVLDAFTHQSGFFVGRLAFLQERAWGVPVYKIAQHSLSLAGGLGEAALLLTLLRRTRAERGYVRAGRREKARYWGIVLLTAVGVPAIKLVFFPGTNLLGALVVSSISGFFAGIVAASVVYRFRLERQP